MKKAKAQKKKKKIVHEFENNMYLCSLNVQKSQ